MRKIKMSTDVCRICLSGNMKMEIIVGTPLQDIHERLTSTQWCRDKRPLTVCYICHSQLKRCLQLKEMSKISEDAFAQFFACGFEFTEDTLPILNRRNLQKISRNPATSFTIYIPENSSNLDHEILPDLEIQRIINARKLQKMLRTPVEILSISPEKNEMQSKCTQTVWLVTPVETMPIGSCDIEMKEEISLPETLVIKQEYDITADPNTPENNDAEGNNLIENNPRDIILIINKINKETDQIDKKPCEIEPLVGLAGNGELVFTERNTFTDNHLNGAKLENSEDLDKNDSDNNIDEASENIWTCKNNYNKENKRQNSESKDTINYKNLRELNTNEITQSSEKNYTKEKSTQENKNSRNKVGQNNSDKDDVQNKHKQSSAKNNGRKSMPSLILRFPLNINALKTNSQNNTKRASSFDMFRKSTPEKAYPSKSSSKSLPSNKHFENHLQEHTKEARLKMFNCSVCPKTFSRVSHLRQHEVIHTDELPFECNICKKGFKQKSNLEQHFRTHTGERPYGCDNCSKRFKQKSNLIQHVRVHNKEKPFSCDECGKSFRQSSNLKQHQRIHTGVKPYDCSFCGKIFRQKSNLIQHVKIMHGSGKS